MADFTAIQIGADKINVKDETARADAAAAKKEAGQAASNATDAKREAGQAASDAAVAKEKVESISFTYNGTNTIIWNGGN